MAATGNKGNLGWLVLAAALAVPGFLFYNWWSHMKAGEKVAAAKARSRLPDGAVFQTAPPSAKLTNPMSTSTAPLAAAPNPAATPQPTPAPTPAPAVEPAGAAAPPAAPVVAANPAAADAAAPAVIVLPRDPMLSPMDIVRIREAEVARERSRLELEEANRRRQSARHPAKRVEPPVENHIDLQGTVDTPDGASLAIVNNATMSAGESFSVEGYAAKVRIVKISAAGVTFEYKKRRFVKSVNQE